MLRVCASAYAAPLAAHPVSTSPCLYKIGRQDFDFGAQCLARRLNSQLGPLRIDYGHNLNRSEGESGGAIHIGFGVAF